MQFWHRSCVRGGMRSPWPALPTLMLLTQCGLPSTIDDTARIVDVQHTDVAHQVLGNCWLYGVTSWAESMHLARTGDALDLSQSYWTYWSWFNSIPLHTGTGELSLSGHFESARSIIQQRGWMVAADFSEADSEDFVSSRESLQFRANQFIHEALRTGSLNTPEARKNPTLVRQVLNEAFGLREELIAAMDAQFGTDGAQRFTAEPVGMSSLIAPATQLAVTYTKRTGSEATGDESVARIESTLASALTDWAIVSFPAVPSNTSTSLEPARNAQADVLRRLQRALHHGQPVILSWGVDWNAFAPFVEDAPNLGAFSNANLQQAYANLPLFEAPGTLDYHMTVAEDYQATTEKFGLMPAGNTLDPWKDRKKLKALLEPSTTIEFLRMKNSWGTTDPGGWYAAEQPGYNDVYIDYLLGPVDKCSGLSTSDLPNVTACTKATPLSRIVLPPGY